MNTTIVKKIFFFFFLLSFLFSCTKDKDNTAEKSYHKDILTAENVSSWGLGEEIMEYYNVDREYEWYVDQLNTGEYSEKNSGPAVASMLLKWSGLNTSITAGEIRAQHPAGGDFWKQTDLVDFLSSSGLDYEVYNFENEFITIQNSIDSNQLIVVFFNPSKLSLNLYDEERTGCFYVTDNIPSHFIIIKGYAVVDYNAYLEVYDPMSMGNAYEDSSLKGKNRYYLYDEVAEGISDVWNYVIAIKN